IEEKILSTTPVRNGVIGAGEYGSPLISFSDPAAPTDFNATVYASWNASGLNLAIKVVDESISPPDGTTPEFYTYGGDNVRIRLDFANDGFLDYPTGVSDNLEIGIQPAGVASSPNRIAVLHVNTTT